MIYYIIEPDSSIYEKHDIEMKEVGACVYVYAHPYMYKRVCERSLHTEIMMMINIQKIRIQ